MFDLLIDDLVPEALKGKDIKWDTRSNVSRYALKYYFGDVDPCAGGHA